jgi:tRNA(fMet)-specific endonuclease VapC
MRVFDSDHCIELLRGRLNLAGRVAGDEVLGVTSISVGELLHGAERSAQRERNLARVEVLLAAARRFGRLKAELERSGQSDLDLQTAAICLEAGATLLTHNSRHFARIPGLAREDWLA